MTPILSTSRSAEKSAPLGAPATTSRPARSKVHSLLRWAFLAVVFGSSLSVLYPEGAASILRGCSSRRVTSLPEMCPQEEALVPRTHIYAKVGEELATDAFRMRAVKWQSGAIQIPTESYDMMEDVGKDPRWEAFGPFHDYLKKSFPLVHANLELKKVNTYGLIYTWKGSDDSLKPLLLLAHQDVVPVDPTTVGQWAHPPYSGFYDGTRIWGRGASDDKNGLVGLMITVETLLEKDFAPARGIVLSFGFDEEASGKYGARENAKALAETYGEDAFEMIVDEGGGFVEMFGSVFAVPAVAEKGYLDVRIDVHAPGGHSSIPPAHTSIGMLSQMIMEYEANPYTPTLKRDTPVFECLQCFAAHAEDMPKKLRRELHRAGKSNRAMRKAQEIVFQNLMLKGLAGTTQAIDVITGDVKSNALPEQAYALVNHRIETTSSVAAVMKRDTKLLEGLAHKFNLSFVAFGTLLTDEDTPAYGRLELSDAGGSALEPAPVTPTDAAPYKLLSGTIKAVYAAHRGGHPDRGITVAPGAVAGNTDTRHYWKLSKHIFRYDHTNAIDMTSLGGVHTVNESIPVDTFLETIRFFNTLILNVDEARE